MKPYFLFFFIVHTYCALIPNNKVNTNSDSAQDFSLVEGITYKIVHLKSGSNLDSDGNDIYVSSAFNPYQYWSFRKANDNDYNIISAKTSLNLDSDGQKTYFGTPSLSNRYQQWIFKKINDDIYNIAHANSESRNLDSNGRDVYIGSSSKTNSYQQWSIKPSNYKLNAVVENFEYPPDLKYKLDRYKTRTSLLSGSILIRNPTNATIIQTIDKTERKVNSYTLRIRKSESFKVIKDIGLSFNIGRTIFGLLGINTGFHGGIKSEFNSTYEEEYRESVSEEVKYRIQQKVKVPSNTSIMVNSSVDKIRINIPFKAKIRITAKADRLDENGKIVPMTDVDANALRCYLQKEYYDAESITEEGNSLIISTKGTLRMDGYGYDALIEAIPIKLNPNPPSSIPTNSSPNPNPTNPTYPDPYPDPYPDYPDSYPPINPTSPEHNPFSESSVLLYFTLYLLAIFSFFSLLCFTVYKFCFNRLESYKNRILLP